MNEERPGMPMRSLQGDSYRRPGRETLPPLIVVSGRGLERENRLVTPFS